MSKKKLKKRQIIMFCVGIAAILLGVSILAVYGYRGVSRRLQRMKLMRECIVVEIPELKIKAPILEGTDNETLSKGAGHFTGTGAPGSGNYCIAAHSSVIYKEYFNNLKNIRNGMEIKLTSPDGSTVSYRAADSFIVEPSDTWILNDAGDCRITLVTCTDDGTQRQVVVGKLVQ